MALDVFKERGVPIEKQTFDWHDLVPKPISKLNDDAFTRVRIILMNGIEQQKNRFMHHLAQFYGPLRIPLAQIRRAEHHQQTLVNWLLPPDQSPLETTIGYEQVAIEVTAMVAQNEPDPYQAQIYRFGLLEDFDHLYRYSALMDRIEGKDANNILQCYTDVVPGRPASVEHRAPVDDVRNPYDRKAADPLTKIHALTLVGGEYQARDFYMTVGPMYADPVGRLLYAEIASIEEQHVTQYESLCDPDETPLEKLMLYELTEVYNYASCVKTETNPRIKDIWQRFLDYELGHLHFAMEVFRQIEKRDPKEIIPESIPETFSYTSQRDYVRDVLKNEAHLRAKGPEIIDPRKISESEATERYRAMLNSKGSPSDTVAEGWRWRPGTELVMGPGALQEISARRLQ
ncbi:MAG: hypothetical protein WBV82_07765 [Myxococcaceae bacterium]